MRALQIVRTAPVRLATRVQDAQSSGDAGMTTAEYAVGTVGACGFGGLLIELLKSEAVQKTLRDIVMGALHLSGIG
ncbi:MAG: hypothetical protein JWN17_1281 [Frankiales bacterium]|nr:hypothetical protein [Frankiales bacterium]